MDYIHTIRHFLTVLAMRLQHAVRNAPEGFDTFEAGHGVRPPRQILEHMVGMIYATRMLLQGEPLPASEGNPFEKLSWNELVQDFHDALAQLDHLLANSPPEDPKAMFNWFQGPLCDVMTHIGQLMTLRRLAGAPVETAMYYKLDLKVGQVGPDQPLE